MNLKKLFGLLAIAFCCLTLMPLSARAASILYVDTYNSTSGISSLYTLTTTGTATKVGDIKLNGNSSSNLFITDIAFNENTGKMFAITATTLYTLDYLHPSGSIITATQVGTDPTGTKVTRLQGLTVSSNGTIYADSSYTIGGGPDKTGHLYTIDSSGTAHNVGSNGSGENNNYYGNYGDLAFVGSSLYGTIAVNSAPNPVYWGSINSNAGTVTLGSAMTANIDGLAYIDSTSTLYGISRTGTLYTLNPSTGAILTTIPTTGFLTGDTVYGATHAPIPPSAFLLGSGLLGLGLLGWRRKIG